MLPHDIETPTPGRSVAVVLLALSAVGCASSLTPAQDHFEVDETTISDIHAALVDGTTSCVEIVQGFLNRIAAYDNTGPALNALVTVSDAALDRAAALDQERTEGTPMAPLHCVPVIVKDNFDTLDLPTTAGSLSLAGFRPDRDAFQVRKIREAGGIVIAKSNMAEFAFSPYETVSSILPGYTRNPYDLARVPAGSSGGTAAGVAASFGAVGLGSDTGNSIRGPSSHQALVGIRSTMGLTSRSGVVPLNLASDIAGPMARTVADAAAVLQVVEGYDPNDPVTAVSRAHMHRPYTEALDATGLDSARIGVLRHITDSDTADPAVIGLFEQALADIVAQNGVVLDPVELEGLAELQASHRNDGRCQQFKFDLNAYLAGHSPRVPVTTLDEIIESGQFHPSIRERLVSNQAAELAPPDNPACTARDAFREKLREIVLGAMDAGDLAALVYPTWNNPPRLIGDLNTPHGDNNQLLAPSTGFPAITVPMGYVDERLPTGLQFLGRPWDEFTLIRLAYAYEQATGHRRPAPTTPPLPIEPVTDEPR